MQKTLKDVEKLLKHLFRDGKPTIVSSQDYKWIHPILSPNDKKAEIYWNGEPVWFDTLKTKVKLKTLQCELCGKSDGIVKFYTMTNDMQRLKAYHSKCFRKLTMEK
jgi:hypothetical protein